MLYPSLCCANRSSLLRAAGRFVLKDVVIARAAADDLDAHLSARSPLWPTPSWTERDLIDPVTASSK